MAKNQKLNATLTIGAALQASVRKNLDVVGRGLKNVGTEIGQISARKRELDKQRAVLIRQGQSVDALDREYQQLNRTLDRLRDKQRRLEALNLAGARVGASFRNTTTEVGRLARRGAVVVGGLAAATYKLADDTASLGDQVAKQADAMGIGIEALQELQYSAERSGVSTDALTASLGTMNKNIGDAARGLGRARKAFEQLQLSPDELASMAPDAAFELLADRLAQVEDQSERTSLAMQIFGGQGQALNVMLRDGAAGVRALRDDARALGFVLGEDAARAAEVFKDAQLDAQLASRGLRTTIGSELMPVVTDVMREFTGWVKTNREPVQELARDFAGGVKAAVPVLAQVIGGLGEVSRNTAAIVGSVADMVGGWRNFGVVLGTVFAGKAILAFGGFVFNVARLGVAVGALVAPAVLPAFAAAMGAIGTALPLAAAGIKAVGLALAANPIGAVLAALAIGATLVVANWEKIEPYLRPVLDWLGEKLGWLWDNAGRPLVDGMVAGARAIPAAWERMKAGLGVVVDWIGDKFDWLARKVEPVIAGLTWVRERAGGAWSSMFGSDAPDPAPLPIEQQAEASGWRLQRRAVGGAYRAGPVLVGERGPELRFEDRAGFIATNRQLRDMAGLADRIRGAAAGGAERVQQAAQSLTISGGINIYAQPGQDVRAIADEVMRRLKSASRGALYDPAAAMPGG